MLPALIIYPSNGGLKSASHGYYNSMWMLGNMGFNKYACVTNYVQLDADRVLGCEIGTMTKLKFAGIIPDSENLDSNKMPYAYCGDPTSDDAPGNSGSSAYTTDSCTTDYVSDSLSTWFDDNCIGETECTITLSSYVFDDDITANNGTTPCTTNPAMFYLQYACE